MPEKWKETGNFMRTLAAANRKTSLSRSTDAADYESKLRIIRQIFTKTLTVEAVFLSKYRTTAMLLYSGVWGRHTWKP